MMNKSLYTLQNFRLTTALGICFIFLLSGFHPDSAFALQQSGVETNGNEQSQIIPDVLKAAVDSLFTDYDTDTTPGCIAAVYRNGETVIRGSYGMANLDYGIPLNEESRFYMASLSKQVTAAAAALLIVRGELDEEDFVNKHIEDWPEWASEVKIKHLFNHTSGLPDIYNLMNVAGISVSNVMSIDDYLEVIKNGESLSSTPGEEFSYTNSGYTVLAALIEQITGDPFSVFVEKNILSPLGMKHSHFHDSRYKVIPNRVISYSPGEDAFRHTYLSNFQGVGPGGLYSTTGDWQKWDRFLHSDITMNEELSSVQSIMLNSEELNNNPFNYAKGLETESWMGMNMLGHSGSFMGFKNDYRHFPEHNLSFLTLCNRRDAVPGDKNLEMARLMLRDSVQEYVQPYSGTYYSPELEVEYKLTVSKGNLILERKLSPNGPLEQDDNGQWSSGSLDFEFLKNENGEITGFLLSSGRVKDVEFSRRNL